MTYIKFSNQTLASKAASLLVRHGYRVRVRRNPNPSHTEGCNFALFVSGDIFDAFDIVRNHFIPNYGIEHFGDDDDLS